MIKIADNYYELNLIDIIKELKIQLSDRNLFSQIKELPEDIMVSCPFHKEGQERRPSCGIRKADGWVHCFTCEESCSLTQMISRCFGYDDIGQYGLSWLKNNFLGDIQTKRDFDFSYNRKVFEEEPKQYVSKKELEKYRYWHPYMEQRKLTDEVIDLFDIGYDEHTDCITFPVRNIFGQCLFVARRSVKTKFFNYPSNVEKPVYGVYELYTLKEFPKEIYICESMIDALTLWGVGKYAVALNGLGTEKQFDELKHLPCRKFILATDNDTAGQKARKILKEKLKTKLVTEAVIPSNRKDINECSFNELRNLEEII